MNRSPPGTRALAGYTAWNLFGLCVPMAVAIFAIPMLIHGLGPDRFGALSLVWMLVGYFSVLDFGLGRALTKLTAEYIGRGREADVPRLFWTALAMMLALGALGALTLAALSDWLVNTRLQIPEALKPEIRLAFKAVAFGLPVAVATTGLVGILEAHHRFRLINIIRVPMGIFTFVGPLLVLPFSQSLFPVVTVLIAGRVVEWLVYFSGCLAAVPALRHHRVFDRHLIRPLAGFGGWMTVSNLALPLMAHVDRLLIGALLPIAKVTYYATPAEIVVKMLIIPRSWVSAIFPSMTAAHAGEASAAARLYSKGIRYLLIGAFPLVLAVMLGAPEGLRLWLGAELAAQSMRVMQWLAAGIFFSSLAYVPFSLLQSAGRPDLSAKLHAIELPLYLTFSIGMIHRFGIEGAAMAWFIRATLECLILFRLAHAFAPAAARDVAVSLGIAGLSLPPVFAAAFWGGSFGMRTLEGIGILCVFLTAAGRMLLTVEERNQLVAWISRRRKTVP